MNLVTFFAYARRAPFGGRLSTAQMDGMKAILAEAVKRGTPDQHLAYMLATAFHETGSRMQPIRENLNYTSAARIKATWPKRFPTIASAKPYVRNPQKLANKVYGGRLGNTGPNDGWIYRGDGLPQLTGKANFAKFGIEPGMDLPTAVRVMFDGMTKGMFTTRKLADYFDDGKEDPVGARAIVNGTDKASLIAGYYRNFLDSLTAAHELKPAAVEDAQPDDKPAAESGSIWTIAGGLASGGGLAAFTGGPWGFAALAMILVALGVGAWLVASGRVEIKRLREAL